MKNINKEDSLRAYIRHLPLRPMKMYVPPGTMVWIIIMIAIVFYAISLEEQGMQYTVLRIGGVFAIALSLLASVIYSPKGEWHF